MAFTYAILDNPKPIDTIDPNAPCPPAEHKPEGAGGMGGIQPAETEGEDTTLPHTPGSTGEFKLANNTI